MAKVELPIATYDRQTEAMATVADTNNRVKAVQSDILAGGITMNTIAAHMEQVSRVIAENRRAKITIRLNPTGAEYAIPDDAERQAELLAGAKIVMRLQGVSAPFEAAITSLEDFSVTFHVVVTDAAQVLFSSVGGVLGRSDSAGYAINSTTFRVYHDDALVIDLTTSATEGELVEMCRVQPWSDNPEADSNSYRKAGVSFLGTRITTASGSTLHLGHYAADGVTWIDESMTAVVLWKCPDADTEPIKTYVKSSDDTVDRSNWVDLMDRLNVFKGLKEASLVCTGTAASHPAIPFVRFPKVYIKREKTTVNLPIADNGGSLADNPVECMVTWFCDRQADAGYRPMDAFLQPVRQDDGSYAEVERDFAYISRYPISNSQNLTVTAPNGTTAAYSCARVLSGEGREYVPGNKQDTLVRVKPLNWTTMTLSVDGEEDTVITRDEDSRTISPAGSRHIGFLQQLAYLFFGVNPQGACSSQDLTKNTFPGICTSSVASTTNGATDYILALGKWNGAANPQAITNSILFLGIEDALWSSTGWYNENITFVLRRAITTNEEGAITGNEISAQFLHCQDAADLQPCASGSYTAANNTGSVPEITTVEGGSFEGYLKSACHYAPMPAVVTNTTKLYRAMDADIPGLRDLCYPTDEKTEVNINMGACDNFWKDAFPNYITAFSSTKAYSQGAYAIYDEKLYRFTTAHAAGAWTGDDAELVTSKTVTQRKYELVAVGTSRGHGSSLGSFSVSAAIYLAPSIGDAWRARLVLF